MTTGKKLQAPSANSEHAKKCASGAGHWKADLTDGEVDLIRHLHEVEGWGYKRLAKKFDKPRQTIANICRYRTR